MKKKIVSFIGIIYAIIAIFVTVCLLSFNDYRISEFGNTSLVPITNNSLEPNFNKGDLVIAHKDSKIVVGDYVFFYNRHGSNVEISYAKVEEIEVVSNTQNTYTLEGDYKLSSDYIIGVSTDITVMNKVGAALSILESRWGFLFLIVLPTLIAFLYEIVEVITELRENSNDKKEENNVDEK